MPTPIDTLISGLQTPQERGIQTAQQQSVQQSVAQTESTSREIPLSDTGQVRDVASVTNNLSDFRSIAVDVLGINEANELKAQESTPSVSDRAQVLANFGKVQEVLTQSVAQAAQQIDIEE